jgi:CheY-like chemotaxis protein
VREVSVSVLRDELIRLGAIVVQTRLLHPCGLKLHSPGDVLTLPRTKLMAELGMEKLWLLEPGEGERAAERALSTEMVPLMDLERLDVVAEDIHGADGGVAIPAGTVLDEPHLKLAFRSGAQQVTIRRRGIEGLLRAAREYAGSLPPGPARPPRPDTRVTQMTTRALPAPVRPLLVPRARVIVALKDEFQRALVSNALAAEGHEVSEQSAPREAALAARSTRPDLAVIDLADAPLFLGMIRAPGGPAETAVIVAGDETRKEEVYRALQAGANDSLSLPPRPPVLLEKLRGCLQAMGKRVNVKPHVQAERRSGAREPGHFACGIVDRFLAKPLPVSSATVIDVGEGGLRVEYARPDQPGFDSWTSHAVHPRHYFYNYSKQSPLGRDLTVLLPSPAPGAPLEAMARFVHIEAARQFETAGLVFQKVRGSVRDHLSLIRGKATVIRPPTAITVRRPAF